MHRRPRTVGQLRHHRWVGPSPLPQPRLGFYSGRHRRLLRVCCERSHITDVNDTNHSEVVFLGSFIEWE